MTKNHFKGVLLAKLLTAAVLFLAFFDSALASNYSKLIPHPFYAVQSAGQNKVMYIDDGIAALALRVDMIRRAKRTIEVEYFIFNVDTSARIFVKELIAAAKR